MMQPFDSSSRHFAVEESGQSPDQLLPLAFLGNISDDHAENSSPPVELLQQQCRSKMTSLSKIIAICLLLFAATNAVLATVAVADEEVIAIDDDNGDGDDSSSPTPSLTLSLFLDDATAKEIITFAGRLQDITADADKTINGHRMLRGGDSSSSSSSSSSRRRIRTEIITPEDLVDGNEWHDDSEEPRVQPYTHNSVRDASNGLAPVTTSKGLPWGWWVRERVFALPSHNGWQEETGGDVDRNRRRASSASVNTAFDDSEKALLSLLEDTICDEIEKAFPRAFPKSARRRCRLRYSHPRSAQTEGIETGSTKTDDSAPTETEIMLGSDIDEHGCVASAGYSWCEALGQCHRPWETRCDNGGDGAEASVDENAADDPSEERFTVLGNDRDDHGCNRSAGFTWCEVSKSCHRPWETSCPDDDNSTGDAFEEHFAVLGNDRDENGCNRSAGFTWCEVSKSCHRTWETPCGDGVTNGVDKMLKVA